MKIKKILITSVGTATSVGLIKHLKKFGFVIYGTDINDFGYTAGSLMVDQYFKVPIAVEQNFTDVLREIVIQNEVDLLIPINDVEIFALVSNNFNTCKMLVPSLNIINLVRNKHLCSKFIDSIGIRVPYEITENYSGKCIIRDKFGVGSRGITITDRIDINDVNFNTQFAQKFIEGEEFTVDILSDWTGKPNYIIPRKRLEVKSGVATKVIIENNLDLISIVQTILNHISIPGFSNIQFIIDGKGDCYFIEINYRIGGCSSASLIAAKHMVERFIDIAEGKQFTVNLNEDVKWGSVVTRYYEEKIYLP